MAEELKLPDAAEIEAAAARVEGIAVRSPLVRLAVEVPDTEIYLKLENLQPLGAFKIRAAVNALLSLPEEKLAKGVYTGSAGNFGQGLAAAAARLGLPCAVYAPDTAAKNKLDALEQLGATVHVVPFDEWWRVLEKHGHPDQAGVFIHPVANSAVIAGNATIGAEIVADLEDIDAVVVPFGGGGLISGIGAAVKAVSPKTRILACESEAGAPLAAAFQAGGPVTIALDHSTFIDGIGSTRVLPEMWPLLRDVVNGTLIVSVRAVREAVRTLATANAVVAEGAGAVSVAAAMAGMAAMTRATGADGQVRRRRVVCVVSGGNIDLGVLRDILAAHPCAAEK